MTCLTAEREEYIVSSRSAEMAIVGTLEYRLRNVHMSELQFWLFDRTNDYSVIERIRVHVNKVKSCRDGVRRLSSLPGLWCWARSVFPPLKRWAIVGCPWRDEMQSGVTGGTKRNVWPSLDGLNVAFPCDSSRQGRLKIAHRFNGGSGCTQFRKSRKGRKILGRLEIHMRVLHGFELI